MRINKISEDSAINTYFETMTRVSKAGEAALVKEASAASVLGFGTDAARGAGKADDAAKAALKAQRAATAAIPEGEFRRLFHATNKGEQTRKLRLLAAELADATDGGKKVISEADAVAIVGKYVPEGQAKAAWNAIDSGDIANFKRAEDAAGGADDAAKAAKKAADAEEAKAAKKAADAEEAKAARKAARKAAEDAGKMSDPKNVAAIIENEKVILGKLDEIKDAAARFAADGNPAHLEDVWKALDMVEPAVFRTSMKKSLEGVFQVTEFAKQNAKNSFTVTGDNNHTIVNQFINQQQSGQDSLGPILGGFKSVITRAKNSGKAAGRTGGNVPPPGRTPPVTPPGRTPPGTPPGRTPPVTPPGTPRNPGADIDQSINITMENLEQVVSQAVAKIVAKNGDDYRKVLDAIAEMSKAGKIDQNTYTKLVNELKLLAKNSGKMAGQAGPEAARAFSGSTAMKWLLGGTVLTAAGWAAYNKKFPWQGDGSVEKYPETGPLATTAPNRVITEIARATSSGDYRLANEEMRKLKDAADSGDRSAKILLTKAKYSQQLYYKASGTVTMDPPFITDDGVELIYAYVRRTRGSAADPENQFVVDSVREGLDDEKGAGGLYNVKLVEAGGNAQVALNNAFSDAAGFGLAERGLFGGKSTGRRRSRRLGKGRRIRELSGMGHAGRGAQTMGRDERRRRRRAFQGKTSSERLGALMKFAEISSNELSPQAQIRRTALANFYKEASASTNNKSVHDYYELIKSSDDMSKSYCKDAVTDLNNDDKYLRNYFTGLKGLYDEKSETPKGDYKTLYNVHDETGEDLIHAAHPKAVVVSDSIGRGGLVENGLEQKRQTHGVALSAPTGNYRANYA